MFIHKLNGRYLNLDYLIIAEMIDHEARRSRVTIETGLTFDLEGDETDRLFGQLDALAASPYPAPVTTLLRSKPDSQPIKPAGKSGKPRTGQSSG